MVTKKPRIVIIGAGMAGLTAANKLHTSRLFEISVVEGGGRIGGRISSSEFCGDRIEQGATWIHGIEGSPVYKIATETETDSLVSNRPWECMDAIVGDPVTIAEGGHLICPNFVSPISDLFKKLMDFVQGDQSVDADGDGICGEVLRSFGEGGGGNSVGEFLRRGLAAYWAAEVGKTGGKVAGNWSRKSLESAIFAMHESIQRTFTSADDLRLLDYNAERDYVMFPGDEVTIGKGYSSVIETLASVLPAGMVQLNRKVEKIEWGSANRPVKIRFGDGSTVSADHVIVTCSLGVLKKGINPDSCMFNPPLPNSKNRAISKLGYGVVNKVFLKLNQENENEKFPFLQMVFHPPDSGFRSPEIPNWIRRTSFLSPIYSNSKVVLSWFTGKEALELENLKEEEIINGFSSTVSNLLSNGKQLKFERVLRTQWGSNPLFLGSYSYIEVGSSIDDMDTLAEPLPETTAANLESPPLQILFAGEATHRTHYSTTHGAYFSGLREANRLLKHYNYANGV